jgi:hypothetical protein
MIDRREILDTASLVSLNAHVVEKDYVLGWMLAGIAAHAELRDSWVFKGGTCLKKCFFETSRYAEAFGEKIRALAERTRPRDLYDVINLFRNASARPAASLLLDILCQKCAFKNIAIPSLADLAPHRANLDASWQNMLAHQLPALLPVESFWNELPVFFAWLEGGADPNMPPAYAVGSDETVLRDRFLKLSVTASVSSCIEVIRFAAFNRHCVELDYRDENGRRTTKIIEPYSLRQTTAGAILLYVYDVEKNVDNTVHIDRIGGVRVTSKTFIPRYEIELIP